MISEDNLPYSIYPVINGDYLRQHEEGANAEYRLFTSSIGVKIFNESADTVHRLRKSTEWRYALSEFHKLRRVAHSGTVPKAIAVCVVSHSERDKNSPTGWITNYHPAIMMEHISGKRLDLLKRPDKEENRICRRLNTRLFKTTGYVQLDNGGHNVLRQQRGKSCKYYLIDADSFTRDKRKIKEAYDEYVDDELKIRCCL